MEFTPTGSSISTPETENPAPGDPYQAPAYDMPPEPGVDLDEPEPGLEGAPMMAAELPQRMSPDEFFDTFRGFVQIPNGVLYLKGQEPLTSLIILEDDEQARRASDAIYQTCLEIPWLRWMVAPENVYVQRLSAVGLFAWTRFQLVKMELNSRAADADAKADDQPATATRKTVKVKAPSAKMEGEPPKVSGEPDDDAAAVDQGVTELEVTQGEPS